MKIVKLNGLKIEIVDLNYDVIKEEMENCEKKGKAKKAASYLKLLNSIQKDSAPEVIENEVNKIIDNNRNRIKELNEEMKVLEAEIALFSNYSEREAESDVLPTIISSMLN